MWLINYQVHILHLKIIGSGGSASVYIAKWKNTLTKCAIKKFVDDKEVCLTYMANSHDNIIQFRGITKLEADFGCSCLKESDDDPRVHGVTPYMDPKFFENHSYRITKKSDIYSLGVLFWELTSRCSPFKYKSGDDYVLRIRILNGLREKPIQNTNAIFVKLYQKCWQHEPDNRPNIHQVISELNRINYENNIIPAPGESEESENTDDLCLSD
ncbi:kinase-like protein [Rhizophagus irregularis]|uniref:Kinase-like protein n=1 Tax=Rhizophagus irregularis TaxID=588596 RepID=A0A2I1E310_9GLOM|nr:kinase-like protein [Rhizophagus irregularis]PKY16517.1 kinase-like protein [Rhizophagus irregularis]